MKVIHAVPCFDEANGVYRVAKLLAKQQRGMGNVSSVLAANDFNVNGNDLGDVDEVWVHGMWLPREWKACWKVIRAQSLGGTPRLVRMTHGSLSPVYLNRQSKWKKRLVSPIERWLFSKCERIVTTGEWEVEWCRKWGLGSKIEIVDIKQFFKVDDAGCGAKLSEVRSRNGVIPLKVLYLGRQHVLKGVHCLRQAVSDLDYQCMSELPKYEKGCVKLREIGDAHGEELEMIWDWCDVLCLPTLSENFGLVIAEALERGKYVITTDGAPAWSDLKPEQGIYLCGYREGTDEARVKLLKDALLQVID